MAIGGHHSALAFTDEWLTPPSIIEALGPFDVDPCSPVKRPWDTARQHYSIQNNGLNQEWNGRVWLNPPYGRAITTWMKRMAEHGNGIALVFARTETEWFSEHVFKRANLLLFLRGRIHFHNVEGKRCHTNTGAPSVLIAYDSAIPSHNAIALTNALMHKGLNGTLVDPRKCATVRSAPSLFQETQA